jgi:hypothetical protein
MTNDLLRDYELKRGRALHHFDVLQESVQRFSNIEREPVPGEFNANSGQYLFKIPLEGADPAWALGLGFGSAEGEGFEPSTRLDDV